MKLRNNIAFALAGVLFVTSAWAQQHELHPQQPKSQHPQETMVHPGTQDSSNASEIIAPLPLLSSSVQGAMRLDEFEQLAQQNNPTLQQAEAGTRAARARSRQAGMFPNPVVGYVADEIRGGSTGGGKHGGFIEQRIPLAGKLAANRNVFERQAEVAQRQSEEQRLRVLTAVRIAYYRVLAAQQLVQTETAFSTLIASQLQTARRLQNLGQLDTTEVIQSEIELEQAKLAVERQQAQLRTAWTELATLSGKPDLPLKPVAGSLEETPPELPADQLLRSLLEESPSVRLTEAGVSRAEAAVRSARKAWIPDLQVRVGLQQNREFIEDTTRRVGLQGLAEVGIELPIFNRNQGAVQASLAEVDRARLERQRIQLLLRQRAVALIEANKVAHLTVSRYKSEILPRARQSYNMMLKRWGQMGVSYPQLLLSQHTLFEVQNSYIAALEQLWTNSLALQGFMLTDGLSSPAEPADGANLSIQNADGQNN